jgi:hypothetical protein
MFLWLGGRYVNNANVEMAPVGVNYLFNWSTQHQFAARY